MPKVLAIREQSTRQPVSTGVKVLPSISPRQFGGDAVTQVQHEKDRYVCVYKYMSLEDLQSFRLCSPLDSAPRVLAASVSLNVPPSPRLEETVRFCAGSLSAPLQKGRQQSMCFTGVGRWARKTGFREAFN